MVSLANTLPLNLYSCLSMTEELRRELAPAYLLRGMEEIVINHLQKQMFLEYRILDLEAQLASAPPPAISSNTQAAATRHNARRCRR